MTCYYIVLDTTISIAEKTASETVTEHQSANEKIIFHFNLGTDFVTLKDIKTKQGRRDRSQGKASGKQCVKTQVWIHRAHMKPDRIACVWCVKSQGSLLLGKWRQRNL